MGVGTRDNLRDAAEAFSSNWRNRNLRRAQLGFLGAWTAEWAFTVGLGIVAYVDGGALAVGLVGLLRMLPSAVLAPLLSPFADRGRRERVLVIVSLLRGAATGGAAAVVALSGPVVVVYVLAVVSTIAATLFRPAHSALLPALSRTGHELASANVVRGLLDSVATLIGPLLAALLLAFADVSAVFAVAAAASLWAALLLSRVRYETAPRPAAPRRNLLTEAAEGLRAVLRNGGLRLILGLAAAQSLTRGALTVFSVVVAIELLGIGESGAGTLMAAVGVGAVAGSPAASLLVGTARLGGWFAVGVALWGLPLALIGLFPGEAAALVLLALVGVGNALIDLAGFTLIGRLTPDDVMARVFGVLESLVAVSIGVGSILASALIAWLGLQGALLAIGALCPVLAVLAWRRLRSLDRSVGDLDEDVELLQQVPMLRPLPLPAIEQIARAMEPVDLPEGATVFLQGDIGDRYYVIRAGSVDVVGDGRVVATLRRGDGFGEIALLRRTRRTATVVAREPVRLSSLTSERFGGIVLGYGPSAAAATEDVDGRLARFTPVGPPEAPVVEEPSPPESEERNS
ncbi:MFS transporter [Microbacterium sp. dk485]|uniref:MFS transporter n=1 Tax=Microbacterium sp. dk485 TaxID=2560021 RepID=UPI001073815B|nr:MFS transporter [Microbacterium sp. dk485]TFV84952.1 MFS transporter [Microbacterium sp. dk485]